MTMTTNETRPTYHGTDFRTYAPETMIGPKATVVTMMLCESYDEESDRWEPFYTMVSTGR